MTTINNNFKVKNGLDVTEGITAAELTVSSSSFTVNNVVLGVSPSGITVDGAQQIGPTGPTGAAGAAGPTGPTGPASTFDQNLNTTDSVTFNQVSVGSGSAQGIVYAKGQQNLQLSANGDTGNGAKIFLGSGESGTVQFGHFNNNNVMNVSTASGVQVNAALTVSGAANISGETALVGARASGVFTTTSKIIATATTVATPLEIFNNSSTTADHSSIRYFRQRGTLAPQANNVLGAIQIDSFQTTNGYASNYPANRRFPGIDWSAAGTYSANSAPTQVRLQNRVNYIASWPYPWNVTNSHSTDTTVVEQMNMTVNTTRIKTQNFILYDPAQGWDNSSTALNNPLNVSVFGTQRFGANQSNVGSQFNVSMPTSYTSSTSELSQLPIQFIRYAARTNHIPYWDQYVGSLNTSTPGQINWFAESSTPATNVYGYSMVRGPHLKLNALRYERGNYTVVRGTASTSSTTLLWNTSTKAGDVLGSIVFQGALESQSVGAIFDGDVDGIVLRAYAVNNWQGQNTSTTTDVTYSSNETALRIEHANTTTIGGVSQSTAGLKQQYGVLAEFGKTTSTFNTNVDINNTLKIKGDATGAYLIARDNVNDPNNLIIDGYNIYLGNTQTNIAGLYSIDGLELLQLGTWNTTAINMWDNDNSGDLPDKWGPAIGMSLDNTQKFKIQGSTTTFATHLIPTEDATYDLGSSISKWNNAYVGNVDIADSKNIIVGSTTGTQIATTSTAKLGFYGNTPVVQPAAVADATDAASVITQLNALLARMRDLGLIDT